MEDLMKLFELHLKEDGAADKTVSKYLTNLRLFEKWYQETNGTEMRPDAVTPLDIHDYVSHLDAVRKQAPSTINSMISSLKAFWRFALDKNLSQADPTRKVKQKRTTILDLAPKWLDRRAQSKLLHHIEGEIESRKRANKSAYIPVRNLALVQCMLSAGLRVEEVSNLEVMDIDLSKGFLNVRNGKGGKFATLPINKTLVTSIKNWLEIRSERNFYGSSYLFTSQKNEQLKVRSIRDMIEKYRDVTRIEGLSCHVLRHTYCKNLLDAGHPETYVAYLARHENLQTTRRYTLPSERDLRKMVDSIEQ